MSRYISRQRILSDIAVRVRSGKPPRMDYPLDAGDAAYSPDTTECIDALAPCTVSFELRDNRLVNITSN